VDNGSDHAVILGDKVVITLGGKQFVFSEPVIRKARMMHADSTRIVSLVAQSLVRMPEQYRKELMEGRINIDAIQEAAKNGEITLQTVLMLQSELIQMQESQIKFIEEHVPGVADARAGDNATDAEVMAAFNLVMQLVKRVYQPAKKNELSGNPSTSTTKADSTN